ncbi:MFS transporter [Fodinicola feengrottensis]|uniref:MFS transporter n=1 Tax=Fodinicola feengrottensis TaxID=435914 RepID=UPI002442EBD1|nr:MFS transporter [Fodinicola feengrottensis]
MTKSIATDGSVNTSAGRVAHPGLALAVIVCCQLMMVLDGTIVNIALPKIQAAMTLSTGNLSWVVNAYTLTFGGLLLLGGRAGDILGRRRVLVAGVLLFTVAAAIGGMAPTAGWLIAARAVMGVGAAIAAPTALGLIATTFAEGPARVRALTVFAVVSASSMALGLIVGGALVTLSWRWVMWINVPIGLAVAILAPLVLPESPRSSGRFDAVGALLSAIGPVLLVYGFIAASSQGWLAPVTLGSFSAAIVLLGAFLLVESRAEQPIMPLSLFANRDRAGAYAIRLLLTAAMSGYMFFVPLFMQDVLGVGPLATGLGFLPSTIILVTATRLTGRVMARTGRKPMLVAGAVITAAGMLWLCTISRESSYVSAILAPMVLTGLGAGLLFLSPSRLSSSPRCRPSSPVPPRVRCRACSSSAARSGSRSRSPFSRRPARDWPAWTNWTGWSPVFAVPLLPAQFFRSCCW